ncbi:MAG: hypothetical protein AAF845_19925, partial [Bacteroidota bacterium]
DSLRSLGEAWTYEGPLGGLVRRGLAAGADDAPDTEARAVGARVVPVLRVNPGVGVEGGLGLGLRAGPLAVTPKALLRSVDGGLSLSADARLRLVRGDRVGLTAEADVADDVARRAPTFGPSVLQILDGRGGYYDRRRVGAGLRGTLGSLGSTRLSGILALPLRAEAAARVVAETAQTFRPLDLLGPGPLDADRLALGPDGQTVTTRSVQAELAVGTLGAPLGALPRRAVRVAAEVGDWSGEGPYWTVGGALDGRVNTFARRRALPPALDVRLVGEIGGGALPLTRLPSVEGMLAEGGVGVSQFGALRARTGVPYEGDATAAVFWEHAFRSVLFEVLGLRALAERGYGLSLHGAHARTWIDADRRADLERFGYVLSTPSGWHHELGAGLTGLFGVLRLDVTTRLDTRQTTVGVGVSQLF